jgi:hypothetical protein
MRDLQDCRALVVVTRSWNAASEWNFGIDELGAAAREGRHGLVYVISDNADVLAGVTVPEGTAVRVVRDAAEFEERFGEDVALLMRP